MGQPQHLTMAQVLLLDGAKARKGRDHGSAEKAVGKLFTFARYPVPIQAISELSQDTLKLLLELKEQQNELGHCDPAVTQALSELADATLVLQKSLQMLATQVASQVPRRPSLRLVRTDS